MNHQETELKMAFFTKEVWDNITEESFLKKLTIPGTFKCQTLETIYYDTPSYSLRKAGLALRVRKQGNEWIGTVKGEGSSTGGLHERPEWSVVLTGPEPGLRLFLTLPVGERIEKAVGEEPLVMLLKTTFTRKSMDLRLPKGGVLEFAADFGEIITPEQSKPIREIELELKNGSLADIIAIGAKIAKKYGVFLDSRSKYHQGLELMGLFTDEQLQKEEKVLNPQDSAEEGLTKLLLEHLFQLSKAYEEFINVPTEPLNLHQLRVKLRRLRSLLSFSRPLLEKKEYLKNNDCFRQLGRDLGRLREIDVLLKTLQRTSFGEEKLTLLEQRRENEIEQLLQMFKREGKFTAAILSFWAWLLKNPWKEKAKKYTVETFAEKVLAEWLAEMKALWEDINYENFKSIHVFRIKVKKLRYVLEQYQDVFAFVDRECLNLLKKMQDILGDIHDSYRNVCLIKELIPDAIQEKQELAFMKVAQELEESWEEVWKKLNDKIG